MFTKKCLGDDDEEEGNEEKKKRDIGEKSPAILGSRATSFGGGNELMADQFTLYTVQQKHNQILLIQVNNLSVFVSTVLALVGTLLSCMQVQKLE